MNECKIYSYKKKLITAKDKQKTGKWFDFVCFCPLDGLERRGGGERKNKWVVNFHVYLFPMSIFILFCLKRIFKLKIWSWNYDSFFILRLCNFMLLIFDYLSYNYRIESLNGRCMNWFECNQQIQANFRKYRSGS